MKIKGEMKNGKENDDKTRIFRTNKTRIRGKKQLPNAKACGIM